MRLWTSEVSLRSLKRCLHGRRGPARGPGSHPASAVRISARIRMGRRAPGSGVSWGPPVLEEELVDREGDRERGAHVLRPRLDRHVGRSGLVQGSTPPPPPPSTIAIGAPRVTPAFSARLGPRPRVVERSVDRVRVLALGVGHGERRPVDLVRPGDTARRRSAPPGRGRGWWPARCWRRRSPSPRARPRRSVDRRRPAWSAGRPAPRLPRGARPRPARSPRTRRRAPRRRCRPTPGRRRTTRPRRARSSRSRCRPR